MFLKGFRKIFCFLDTKKNVFTTNVASARKRGENKASATMLMGKGNVSPLFFFFFSAFPAPLDKGNTGSGKEPLSLSMLTPKHAHF